MSDNSTNNMVNNTINEKTPMRVQFDKIQRVSREHTEVSWETRLERLRKLEQLVNNNREIITYMINKDFGRRSSAETLMLEIFPTLTDISHAIRHGKDWMKSRKASTEKWFLPATSYVQPQPLGVVGIISPWNYPLLLSISPLIGAFTAGNRAMIKPSEFTPHFSEWLADTISEYFSSDEVVVINGGTEISQEFSSLPFDHLIFTGSTQVGKHIMRAAAANLTPVTLELGGKSPVVIDADCDLENTVSRIWTGKLLNAGQTCISPDYVLIPETLKEQFISLSQSWLERHYPDMEDNADYSYMINQAQFSRVQQYLNNAKKDNAAIYTMTDAEPNIETCFMPPFIVCDLAEDSELLTDEIFAPVLPMVFYDTTQDAINYVNDRPRPLALYVFSQDNDFCDEIVNKTVSGGVCINDTIYHIAQHDLPFGGVGQSGMGHYHGKYGFDTFSHQKAIFKQSSYNAMGLLQPPYGRMFNKMMKIITNV